MKRAFTILLILILCLSFAPAAYADEANHVTDLADIISYDDWIVLEERAMEISEKYNCQVMIVTFDDFEEYGFYQLRDLAQEFYEVFELGYGAEGSCVLFSISMADRDFDLRAWGYGNTAFTDYGKDVMLDKHILPLLGRDQYFEAFLAYLDKAEEFLAMARNGTPFDIGTDPDAAQKSFLIRLAITIFAPLLIAFALCFYWKSQMKTAKAARKADQYIPPGGFQLTGQQDQFLYRTETRRKIEKKSSSGGGTTIGSKGSSGRSGKF